MSFGEPSPDPVDTAGEFMVGGAIMAPLRWNRVNQIPFWLYFKSAVILK